MGLTKIVVTILSITIITTFEQRTKNLTIFISIGGHRQKLHFIPKKKKKKTYYILLHNHVLSNPLYALISSKLYYTILTASNDYCILDIVPSLKIVTKHIFF